MEINLKNAINKFYPSPTLEMVYFEAIANSIDAGANKIEVLISLQAYNKPGTLQISILDDGEGFNDVNFKKFGTLLEYQDKYHKGLGRLVYLQYFKNVLINSSFGKRNRSFVFSDKFKKKSIINDLDSELNETRLEFNDYHRGSIKTYSYILPKDLVESTKLHFYPTLYSKKLNGQDLQITYKLRVSEPSSNDAFRNSEAELTASNLEDLKEYKVDSEKIDLFSEVVLHYRIKRDYLDSSIITAISVDGRTVSLDLLGKDEIPQGYEMFFLLTSEYFDGKASSTRESVNIDKSVLETVKNIFIKALKDILSEEVPEIKERNDNVVKNVRKKYPYLNGYVAESMVGLVKRDKLIEDAQKRFFQDQKKILDADTLSDKQYDQALQLSSRILTEYIIYRQKIIDKLKGIDLANSESEIHDIIVPTKTILTRERFIEDIYKNNIWLLDDKFMTYSTLLSEMEMKKLIPHIKLDVESDDITRPDIAIVFSKNPTETSKLVDVVIVELKKIGLSLAKREEVVSQLRQRARKLLEYYPTEIGRIWFYGIVDINKEFRISLKESGFRPVYSEDQVFYQEQEIIVDEDKNIRVPIGLNIMSYDALMKDADARNSTFLQILISGIKTFEENTQNNITT